MPKAGGAVFAKIAIAAMLGMAHVGSSAAADVSNGGRIANRWCAECHVVAPSQARGSDAVPSFAQIGRHSLDAAALAARLSGPHPPMPNLSLTRTEIGDLAAYIRSLAP